MPFYTYRCPKCQESESFFKKSSERLSLPNCKCGSSMEFVIPTIKEPKITETVDKFRNVKHSKNLSKKMKKRSHDHFIEVLLPEAIEKAGVEGAKANGWIKSNNKRINKLDTK